MTDPNNTLPPKSSKPAESAQETASENTQSTVESSVPFSQEKEPSAQDKEPSVQDNKPSNENSAGNKPEPVSATKSPVTPRISDTPPPQQKSGQSRFAVFLAVLAIILLAICSMYFWQQQSQQTHQIKQLMDQSSSQNQKSESLRLNIEQKLSKLDDRLFEQQGNIAQLKQQTVFNTQKLTDLGARSRLDWLLAEAEYLMRLANQRLNLEHDIQSAEAMLTSADHILAEINDPGLSEIRKTLANEILSLQQVKHLDRQGLYFKLDALVQNIDALKQQAFLNEKTASLAPSPAMPSNAGDTSEADTENTLLEVWHSIWRDLKQAVTIRRLDQPLPPLMAPEQHYYLKQNLRLMLEQAGLALLNQNSAVYQASLKKADSWLKQYFMQTDPLIQQIQATINDLARQSISLSLPDISHSLRLTKAKIETFYRQHSLNKLSTPDSEPSPQLKPNAATEETSSAEGASL